VIPTSIAISLEVLRRYGFEGHGGFQEALKAVKKLAKKDKPLQEAVIGFRQRFAPPYAPPVAEPVTTKSPPRTRK
jgi:hypothetical protein